MTKSALLLLFLIAILAVSCTSNIDNLPTLGDSSAPATLVDAPKLAISPGGFSGKNVKIVLTYKGEKTTDKTFYRLLEFRDGSAPFKVYVRAGRYDDFILSIRANDKILVYGMFDYDMVKQRYFINVD